VYRSGLRTGWPALTSRWALVVLGIVAGGLGLLGIRAIQQKIETRALDGSEFSSRLISSLVVERNVTPSEVRRGVLDPRTRANMDGDVAELVRRNQVVGLQVWSIADARLLYADPGRRSAGARLPPGEVAQARQGSFTSISHSAGTATTLDLFVPFDLDLDGRPDAVVEVMVRSDPVNQEIVSSTRVLYAAGVALAVLAGMIVWLLRRRRGRVEYDARHDSLTGLGNRVLLTELGRQILADADPERRTALLLLDLDGFKEINDTLGHQAGDELLATLAKRIEKACRTGDTVIRLGGDEFAVLLPATSAAEAMVIGDRLEMAAGRVLAQRGAGISVGVAPVAAGQSVEDAMREADGRLYDLKRRRGRRQIPVG